MFASCVSLYMGLSKLLELGIRASLIMLCLLGSLIIGVATHNSFTAMGQTWLIFYYMLMTLFLLLRLMHSSVLLQIFLVLNCLWRTLVHWIIFWVLRWLDIRVVCSFLNVHMSKKIIGCAEMISCKPWATPIGTKSKVVLYLVLPLIILLCIEVFQGIYNTLFSRGWISCMSFNRFVFICMIQGWTICLLWNGLLDMFRVH